MQPSDSRLPERPMERSVPRLGRILVVDDRLEMAEMLAEGLRDCGYQAVAESSSPEALKRLESEGCDLLVTDLRMPEVDGLALLNRSRQLDPERPVIVMTAFGAIDSAIESIRLGAYHYLTKPFKLEELQIFADRALAEASVRREATALRRTLEQRFVGTLPLGSSPAMRRVWEIVARVAPTDAPVLIGGETGTGKGFVARAIHARSGRLAQPFVSVNCAALPEPLLESELFGHVKGAFSGATSDRPGLFVEAGAGTLFLDEIGDLPLLLQAKLLHALESRSVRPVGASREKEFQARIVAASNRNLRQLARAGEFREDLLYRLDMVPIVIPPLRERVEDLPELLEYFFVQARNRHPQSPVQSLSGGALARLMRHPWNGNVRELAHTLERLVLLGAHPEVSDDDVRESLAGDEVDAPIEFGKIILPIRELQRRYATWALDRLGGQRARTAEKLGVDPKTLAKWLQEPPEQ
jgi:two-component system, NtrC family, response regulator HydG